MIDPRIRKIYRIALKMRLELNGEQMCLLDESLVERSAVKIGFNKLHKLHKPHKPSTSTLTYLYNTYTRIT